MSRYLPWRDYAPPNRARSCESQAFAINTIGLGLAGRLSNELLALARGWIERLVRYASKVPGGIPRRLSSYRRFRYPLRPCRSSNRMDRPNAHSRRMPVRHRPPLNAATIGRGGQRLAHNTGRKLPASTTFARRTTIACARQATIPGRRLCSYQQPATAQKTAPKSRRSLRFGNAL